MPKWKLFSWKTLSTVLTIMLIPFVINLIANYTTWIGTKEKVEVLLKLDGWITIGSILESDLDNLKLTYEDKHIKNVLKVSWRIVNTGSKGIQKFESGPSIVYPEGLNVVEARISGTSSLLKIEKTLSVDRLKRTIEINELGIFNPGDYFRINVYIMDIPDSVVSDLSFDNWGIKGKAVDLKLRKDLSLSMPIRKLENIYLLSEKINKLTFKTVLIVVIGYFIIQIIRVVKLKYIA